MSVKKKKNLHGDTIMEVMFAIAVFATVSLLTMNMMNGGLNAAQRTLEVTMARVAIDTQATALNYVHNSYVMELNSNSENVKQYEDIWKRISSHAVKYTQISRSEFDLNTAESCERAIENQKTLTMATPGNSGKQIFAVNARSLVPKIYNINDNNVADKYLSKPYSELAQNSIIEASGIRASATYPRILYGAPTARLNDTGYDKDKTLRTSEKSIYLTPTVAEGVFDTVVKTRNGYSYDFYIRTCWNSPGSSTFSTLTTIVRLYNPDIIN